MRSSRSYRDFQQQLAARKLDAGYIFMGNEDYLVDEAPDRAARRPAH